MGNLDVLTSVWRNSTRGQDGISALNDRPLNPGSSDYSMKNVEVTGRIGSYYV